MRKKFSVIIPLYNSECSISKCVESIINQTYKNIEIIIVDDGSTDDSLKVCQEKYKENSRVKIYTKSNEGVSSARNFGMKKASGDYILFIDADDYIEKQTIEESLKIIEKYDVDILKFGFYRELGKYKKKYIFSSETNKLIKKEDYKVNGIYDNLITTSDFYNVWNAIIKRDILTNISFKTNIKYGEDYLFIVEAILKSKSIYFNDRLFYHYCINNNAVTQKYDEKTLLRKVNDISFSNIEIMNIFVSNNINFKRENIYYNLIKLLNADLKNVTYFVNYKDYCEICDKIVRVENYSKIRNESNIFNDNEIEMKNKKIYLKNKFLKTIKMIVRRIIFYFSKEE